MPKRHALASDVLAASVRRARSCLLQRPIVSRRCTLGVTASLAAVCDILFDLSQLTHWWPDVQRVRPLPAGAVATGDCALLEGRGKPRLLRIAGFKPAMRLLLVIQGDLESTLVDLAVRLRSSGDVQIDLTLEQALAPGRWGALRQRLALGVRAAASGWALSRLLRPGRRLGYGTMVTRQS